MGSSDFVIYGMALEAGGSVTIDMEKRQGNYDPRRLVMDKENYGRERRIRILSDEALRLEVA